MVLWEFRDEEKQVVFYEDGEVYETLPYEELESLAQLSAFAFVEGIEVSVGDIAIDGLLLARFLSQVTDKLYTQSVFN